MANADALWLPVLPSLKDFGPALTKGVAKDAEKAGKSSGLSFGKAMAGAAVGVAAVAAAGTVLFNVGKTFQDMTNTIRVGTGAAGEDLDSLVDIAKNVGSKVPADFDAIGNAVADLNTMMGLTGDDLELVSSQVLEAGRILGEDVDISAAGKAFNAFGVESQDVAGGLDYLFNVSQATGIGMNDLANQARAAAPAAQALGFSFEETAGMIGQLDNAGLDSGKMMQNMSRRMGDLAKAGESPRDTFNRVAEEIQGMVESGDRFGAQDLAGKAFGTRNAEQFIKALESGTLNLEEMTGAAAHSGDTIMGLAEETMTFGEQWELFKNNTLIALEPIAKRVFDAVGGAMSVAGDVLTEHIIPAFDTVMGAIEGIWNIVAHGDFTEGFREAFGIEEDHPFVDFLFTVHEGLETLGEFVTDTVVPALKDFGGYIVDDIVPALQSMGEWIVDNKDWIVSLGVGVLAVVGAYQAWQLAMTIWNGVTKIATGVQAAFNAVMALNPIMLVVMAVAALVAGLIWFFTQTETGQEIWETFTNALHTAWEWVVDTISTAWTWLWEEVLEPVFNWIADAWETVSEAIDAAWEHVIKPAWEAVENAANWLWEEVLEPIFDWIADAWDETANLIDAAWENVIKPAWDAVENAITWLWEEVLEPIFNWIGEKWDEIWGNIDDVWSRTGKPLFDAIGKLLEGDFVGAWESAKEGIKGIWNQVMEIAAKPIDFVIDIVYNKGLLPVFNAIAGIIGIDELPEFNSILDLVPQFAKGGHYGGGVALVGEEGPELINFNRPGYVHTADETSRILAMATIKLHHRRANSRISLRRQRHRILQFRILRPVLRTHLSYLRTRQPASNINSVRPVAILRNTKNMPITASRTRPLLDTDTTISIRSNPVQMHVLIQGQDNSIRFLGSQRQPLNITSVITTGRLRLAMRLNLRPVLVTRPRRVTLRGVTQRLIIRGNHQPVNSSPD